MMPRVALVPGIGITLVVALGSSPGLLRGQGVTTAAMQGRVTTAEGAPVAGAVVQLTNQANGARWQRETRPDGVYLFDAIGVGTYRVSVRALGYAPQERAGIALTLGQRHVLDISLSPSAVALAPLIVAADPVLNPGRTGPAEIVSRATIADLPNQGRSFLNVTLLSPHVALSPMTGAVPTGGISIGGGNRLYNRLQVDGGKHDDAYRGQSPGRQSIPRPLSLEILEEVQVLTAPFDVRHGDFVGGLVNAVTRSGANQVEASAFAYLTDAHLVRRAGIGGRVGDFTASQLGGTLAGPIVRDRAHYIMSVDVQRRAVPDPGPLITDTAGGADIALIGVGLASALRFREILASQYGLTAGTLGPVNATAPAADLFAKVSLQVATNSRLELSQQYASGDRRDFMVRTKGLYTLSSAAQSEPASMHATRLAWTALFGERWANELRVSHLRERDGCRTPASGVPEIRVFTSQRNSLVAGTAAGCGGTMLHQSITELRNDATASFGRHAVTVGMHAELLRFRDDLLQGSPGAWVFGTLDSLELGRPRQYQRTLPGPDWDGAIAFHATHLGMYAQDRWSVTRTLTVSAGVRLDATQLPSGGAPHAALRDSLGIATGQMPGGALWSPRLGVNYDVRGKGTTFIRGGAGLFSGGPPYRWVSNAYRDDGGHELYLNCTGSAAPAFTAASAISQPVTCGSGPAQRLSAFAPGTRFPQNLKVAAGVDQRLFGNLVASADLLYTRALRQFYVTNANLRAPRDSSEGEANRPLHGTFAPNGAGQPAFRAPSLQAVYLVSNRGGDHALTFTAQLRGELRRVQGSASYSHTRSRDRMWLAHFPARALMEGTVLEGTLEDRSLARSWYDLPHKVVAMATVRLPRQTRLTVSYAGSSGRPFTYTVAGDANADGLGTTLRQDPVYVPRDSADITLLTPAQWDTLDAYIESRACLREQRGRLMARNSCRNPWFGIVNARVVKSVAPVRGQRLEVIVDVYNVANLIDSRRGLSRYDGFTFGKDLLTWRGYDAARGRGMYAFETPPAIQVEDMASRWQIELGARYVIR